MDTVLSPTFVDERPYWQNYPVIRYAVTIANLWPAIVEQRHFKFEQLGYIAGSFAASCINYRAARPNDIDIFAVSNEAAEKIVANCMVDPLVRCISRSDNGLVISMTRLGAIPIQVVRPNPAWHQFPTDILNSFDMTVCRAIVVDRVTVLGDEKAGGEVGKFLRINNPLRSMQRMMKYHRRGVAFSEWELLKLFRAWEDLGPDRKQNLISNAEQAERLAQGEEQQPSSEPDYTLDNDDYWEGE